MPTAVTAAPADSAVPVVPQHSVLKLAHGIAVPRAAFDGIGLVPCREMLLVLVGDVRGFVVHRGRVLMGRGGSLMDGSPVLVHRRRAFVARGVMAGLRRSFPVGVGARPLVHRLPSFTLGGRPFVVAPLGHRPTVCRAHENCP